MKHYLFNNKRKTVHKKAKQLWNYLSHADQSLKVYFDPTKHILAYWSRGKTLATNWGDALNPWIIAQLSKKTVFHIKDVLNFGNTSVYVAIGSVLQSVNHKNLVVWGAGFMYENASLRVRPKKVLLVRGPLSRKIMIRSGVDCPPNYGDPALLMSTLYEPKNRKEYRLGIIPHHIDYQSKALQTIRGNDEIKIIDITSGIKKVVDESNKCEIIASSSLHGLILADSYSIPSVWLKLSNNVLGNDFKFYDYYSSIKYNSPKPILCYDYIDVNKTTTEASIKEIDLTDIVNSCPFNRRNYE